jgi:cell division protein ZapA
MEVRMSSVVRVKILDEEYRIQGDSDPEEVRELAAYVDATLRRLMEASPLSDPRRLAVIASMNIAQELFRERARRQELLEQVRQRVERLSRRIAQAVS